MLEFRLISGISLHLRKSAVESINQRVHARLNLLVIRARSPFPSVYWTLDLNMPLKKLRKYPCQKVWKAFTMGKRQEKRKFWKKIWSYREEFTDAFFLSLSLAKKVALKIPFCLSKKKVEKKNHWFIFHCYHTMKIFTGNMCTKIADKNGEKHNVRGKIQKNWASENCHIIIFSPSFFVT